MKSLPIQIGNFDREMLGYIVLESTYSDQMPKKKLYKNI
jgi:hypothetical protein